MPTYAANGGPWTASGSGLLTLNVVPVSAGDLLVLAFNGAGISGLSTSVSGGGVTTWAQAAGHADTNFQQSAELWWGAVTATGSATITVTNAGATGFNRLEAREFSSSPSGTWSVLDASPAPPTSSSSASGSGTSFNYPSLTGSGVYTGTAVSVFGSMSGGSTTGFTYDNNNGHQELAWDVAAVNAAPATTQTNAGGYEAGAALFGTSGAAATPPPVSLVAVSRPALIVSNAGWRGAGHSR